LTRFILNRIFLAIPTLFFISVIVFYLSKLVPQDPVLSLMDLRGVDTSIDHDDVYEKIYKELNLDLPNFYFTIQPSHFPKTINQTFDTNKKDLYLKLLNSGYSFVDIEKAINNFSQKLDAAKASNNAADIIELNKVYNLESPEQHNGLAHLNDSKPKSFFWPSFYLNGFNNQYHKWLQSIFTNGFGISILDGMTAILKVKKALTWTLSITLIDFFLSLLFGIFIGTYLATNEKGRWQKTFSQILYFLYSIPVFWFATMMVVYFTTDDYGWWTDWFPSVAIDKLDKPYALLAFSKGLDKTEVIRKHILKNALIPTITSMASAFANAFAGSLVLEVIFNIPGMGRLLVSSMESADWNVVFCITLLLSFVTIVSFIIADILYAYVNPKIELNAKT